MQITDQTFWIILFVKLNKAFPFFEGVFSLASLFPFFSFPWVWVGQSLHKYNLQSSSSTKPGLATAHQAAVSRPKHNFTKNSHWEEKKLCQRVGPGFIVRNRNVQSGAALWMWSGAGRQSCRELCFVSFQMRDFFSHDRHRAKHSMKVKIFRKSPLVLSARI